MFMISTEELFNLGVAYGSFSLGDIDQGVHMILPVTDVASGEPSNQVFEDLVFNFGLIDPDDENVGTEYLNTIIRWAKHYGIDIGRGEEL